MSRGAFFSTAESHLVNWTRELDESIPELLPTLADGSLALRLRRRPNELTGSGIVVADGASLRVGSLERQSACISALSAPRVRSMSTLSPSAHSAPKRPYTLWSRMPAPIAEGQTRHRSMWRCDRFALSSPRESTSAWDEARGLPVLRTSLGTRLEICWRLIGIEPYLSRSTVWRPREIAEFSPSNRGRAQGAPATPPDGS